MWHVSGRYGFVSFIALFLFIANQMCSGLVFAVGRGGHPSLFLQRAEYLSAVCFLVAGWNNQVQLLFIMFFNIAVK